MRVVQPLLAEAIAPWQAAGADTHGLCNFATTIPDLPGAAFGLAPGHTPWLDVNVTG